jgi:hypothetical protein
MEVTRETAGMFTSSRSRWSTLKSCGKYIREIEDCYTRLMPSDVAAEVIANTPLSDDYNVLALAAPAIAAAAAPGQFVMVKAAQGHDPLLRRPF